GHDHGKVSEVWRLGLEDWRERKIIDAGRGVREMALSPDGKRLASITTPDETGGRFEGPSRVESVDIQNPVTDNLPDKLWRADAASPYGWLEMLAWSADSNRLAFNIAFDAYPAEIIVAEWDGPGAPRTARLKRPEGLSIRGYGSPLAWHGKADLLFI